MRKTTILCDIGGVLADFDDDRTIAAFARASPLSEDMIRVCLFGPTGLFGRLASGELDAPTFRAVARRAFELDPSFTDDDVDAAFAEDVITPNYLTRWLLEELRDQGMTLTAVSNADEIRYARLERLGVTSLFDHEVLSFRERLMKPSVELMVRALDRSGAAAEQAVFIDDDARNVRSASAVGIASHHFADIEALCDFLSCFDLGI